ncbi:hypothetical protein ACMXYN_11565 [Neptuniibacter sp. PT8_73]|uniref:hypothetical protein n=1 Tax=unclassified Neptuniibacter TaxID=2630693 RepID=UPI0039F65C6B
MKSTKKLSYGVVIATSILTSMVAHAEPLIGHYDCVMKSMDLNFTLSFGEGNKFVQDMDFIGLEKGSYSVDESVITFTPTEKTRSGKKLDVPGPFKRNILSQTETELTMTNVNSDDPILCTK